MKRNNRSTHTFTIYLRDSESSEELRQVPIKFTKSGTPLNAESLTWLAIMHAGMKALSFPGTVARVSFD